MKGILVIGSITDESRLERFATMGRAIGRAVVDEGHVLVNGGASNPMHIDVHAAAGARDVCAERGLQERERILAVVREDSEPHGIGRLWRVRGDVDSEKRMSLIQKADAIIVVGGAKGTKEYLVLAELTGKPIVPVPMFDGVAREYYTRFVQDVSRMVGGSLAQADFEDLDQVVTSDHTLAAIAEVAVRAAKKASSESNYVFIAMPLRPEYDNTLRAIKRAVERVNEQLDDVQYVCERIDEAREAVRVDEQIEERINRAKIVVADVTEPNPNVYYEIGYARGRGVTVIPIAAKGAELQFDVRQVRTEFYDLTATNINELEKRIETFAATLRESIRAVPLQK